jgi:hypothetical protein
MCPALCDGSTNATGISFLPIEIDQIRKLFLWKRIDDVCRRTVLTPVHAHIERAILHEAEPAVSAVKLSRGDTEIEHHSVDVHDAKRTQMCSKLPKIAMDQMQTFDIWLQPIPCCGNGIRISVNANDDTIRFRGLKNGLCMAAIASRTVEIPASRMAGQPLKRFML